MAAVYEGAAAKQALQREQRAAFRAVNFYGLLGVVRAGWIKFAIAAEEWGERQAIEHGWRRLAARTRTLDFFAALIVVLRRFRRRCWAEAHRYERLGKILFISGHGLQEFRR